MYNLFVSANEQAWEGDPFLLEESRCVREYTNSDITEKFGKFDAIVIAELRQLPCIFAYESYCKKSPKFGTIRKITRNQRDIRIEYEIIDTKPFLTCDDLSSLSSELGIGDWEMNRTHWAVKDVELAKILEFYRGISLPRLTRNVSEVIDIETHHFEVALSFPGDIRALVELIAFDLEEKLGPNSCFYDKNYQAQLARPSLNLLLQDIYRNRSNL